MIKEYEYYEAIRDKDTNGVIYKKMLGRKVVVDRFTFFISKTEYGWWNATEKETGATVGCCSRLNELLPRIKSAESIKRLNELYDVEPQKTWRENMRNFLEGREQNER